MRIQDVVVRPFALMVIPCPDCGNPMRLAAIIPVGTPPKSEEMTYRCDTCDCDLKRVSGPKD
jgi:ssDNA-binding Zn-finger/Zn-ribbon topoisomerase 1